MGTKNEEAYVVVYFLNDLKIADFKASKEWLLSWIDSVQLLPAKKYNKSRMC